MKTTINFLENNKENRAKLEAGRGYIVRFRNCVTGETGGAVANWNGEKFEYLDGRFSTDLQPQLDGVYLYVAGFFKASDLEE